MAIIILDSRFVFDEPTKRETLVDFWKKKKNQGVFGQTFLELLSLLENGEWSYYELMAVVNKYDGPEEANTKIILSDGSEKYTYSLNYLKELEKTEGIPILHEDFDCIYDEGFGLYDFYLKQLFDKNVSSEKFRNLLKYDLEDQLRLIGFVVCEIAE